MFIKATRIALILVCFGGFFLQCQELLLKVFEEATTSISSNIEPKNGQSHLPRFSICVDPPTTESRLSRLGLSPHAWDGLQFGRNRTEPSHWSNVSENAAYLYDSSMFSFDEVFKTIEFGGSTKNWKDEQYYKVTNTRYNGKCFTFLFDQFPATRSTTLQLTLNNVFDGNQNGQFQMYLHDRGMELLLVSQWWIGTRKHILDILPGSINDIFVKKQIHRKLSQPSKVNGKCRDDWDSLGFYGCIDQYLAQLRKPFRCRSLIDIALNQSSLSVEKPLCSSFKEANELITEQESAFLTMTVFKRCTKNCEVVSYQTSTTNIKLYGRTNVTTIYVMAESLDTTIKEEVLVYDFTTIISSLGGSLGLFLGFSFLDVALRLVRMLEERFLFR